MKERTAAPGARDSDQQSAARDSIHQHAKALVALTTRAAHDGCSRTVETGTESNRSDRAAQGRSAEDFFFLFFPDDGGSRGGQKPADGREGPSGRRRGVFFNLTSPHGSGQDYQGCSMGSGGG